MVPADSGRQTCIEWHNASASDIPLFAVISNAMHVVATGARIACVTFGEDSDIAANSPLALYPFPCPL